MDSTIYYLGPAGTHSEEAVIRRFGENVPLVPSASLSELFSLLREHPGTGGVVPVLNSAEGPVLQTMEQLMLREDLDIVERFTIPIRHYLLARPDTKDLHLLHAVYSHPQALGQCRETLRRLCPHAILKETTSTAEGARRAAEEANTAAVAPFRAAELYGLKILVEDTQDQPDNTTRFYFIRRKNLSMNRLVQLRSIIASLDETVVLALCQRAQHKINASLYRDFSNPPSLLSIADSFSQAKTIAGRAHILRPFYVHVLLPLICTPGEDEDNRRCISADSSCMDALVQRLNLAEHVATLKKEEMPEVLRKPFSLRSPTLMEEAITNHAVEADVIRRTLEVSRTRPASDGLATKIAHLYENWIIPLSRKIQVHDLLAENG